MSVGYERPESERTEDDAFDERRRRLLVELAQRAGEDASDELVADVEAMLDGQSSQDLQRQRGLTHGQLSLVQGLRIMYNYEIQADEADAVAVQPPLEQKTPVIESTVVDLSERRQARTAPAAEKRRQATPKRNAAKAEGSDSSPVTSLTRYLNEIAKFPLLNAEDEVELAKRYEAGTYAEMLLETAREQQTYHYENKRKAVDIEPPELTREQKRELGRIARVGQSAYDSIVNSNLRLVVKSAKRFTGRGIDMMDLIQEGNTGLMHAAEKFDYTKGYKFSTYATWWIEQRIHRALENKARTIRLPGDVAKRVNKVLHTQRVLRQDLGREPTPEEIGAELDLPHDKIMEYLDYGRGIVSLDKRVGDEGDATLGDFIEDTSALDPVEAVTADATSQLTGPNQLNGMLEALTELEQKILLRTIGDNQPRARVAEELGISATTVSSKAATAIKKLRRMEANTSEPAREAGA